MANIQQKMENARELIRAKRYSEARKLLQTIDHPTARSWIERIDSIAPQVAAQPRKRKWLALTLALALIGVIAAIAIVSVVQQSPPSDLNQRLVHEGIEVSYPDGWTHVISGDMIILSSVDTSSADEIPSDFEGIILGIIRSFGDEGENALEAAQADANGFTRSEDNALVSGIAEVTLENWHGYTFEYSLKTIPSGRAFMFELGDKNVLRVHAIAADQTSFQPRFEGIMNSLSIDLAKMDRFACPIQAWWKYAGNTYVKFLDTLEIGISTPRSGLAPVLIDLRETFRLIEQLDRPACAADGISDLENGLSELVDWLQAFLGQDEIGSSLAYERAKTKLDSGIEKLDAISFANLDLRLRVPELLE